MPATVTVVTGSGDSSGSGQWRPGIGRGAAGVRWQAPPAIAKSGSGPLAASESVPHWGAAAAGGTAAAATIPSSLPEWSALSPIKLLNAAGAASAVAVHVCSRL
jgi:hypothetical protein